MYCLGFDKLLWIVLCFLSFSPVAKATWGRFAIHLSLTRVFGNMFLNLPFTSLFQRLCCFSKKVRPQKSTIKRDLKKKMIKKTVTGFFFRLGPSLGDFRQRRRKPLVPHRRQYHPGGGGATGRVAEYKEFSETTDRREYSRKSSKILEKPRKNTR